MVVFREEARASGDVGRVVNSVSETAPGESLELPAANSGRRLSRPRDNSRGRSDAFELGTSKGDKPTSRTPSEMSRALPMDKRRSTAPIPRFGKYATDAGTYELVPLKINAAQQRMMPRTRIHANDMSDVERTNWLCTLAEQGNVAELKRLFDNITDLRRFKTLDKRTPLHFAASHGHLDAIRWLLEHNAEVNAVDEFGHTPLVRAARALACLSPRCALLLHRSPLPRRVRPPAVCRAPPALDRLAPRRTRRVSSIGKRWCCSTSTTAAS